MTSTELHRMIFGALCATALLAFPQTVTAQASTFVIPFERVGAPAIDPVTGQPIPNTGAFNNPCTAELVDVVGSTTISITQSIDKNGDVRTSVGAVTRGAGTGQVSLAAYSFSESQQFMIRMPAVGLETESNFSDKFALRGAGAIDNWTIRAHFRIKINAAGEVLVSLDSLTGDICKG